MKNQIFTLLVLQCLCLQLQGQWLTNGSKVYYNNGKVGIGTDSPTFSLDVRGNFRLLTSGITRATAHLYASGTGDAGIYFDASNGDGLGADYGSLLQRDNLAIELNNYGNNPLKLRTNNLDRFTILGNGNIGIGTTVPNAKLDVRNGHAYIGDDSFANPGSWGATLNIDDNVHSRVLIEERATGVQTALAAHSGGRAEVGTISNHNFSIVTNNNKTLTSTTNGNIGIGTTAPNARLDVRNGHAYIGDDSFANPDGWGATLNIDDNVHSRVLIEERASGVQTALAAHSGGRAEVGTISNHNFSIVTNKNKTLTSTTNGNIGIGTTAPNAKLDVRNGHAYIGDDSFANPDGWGATLNIDDNVHSRVLIEERASGVQTALAAHSGGRAEVGTISNHNFSIVTNKNKTLTSTTNGNIGIGTTAPNAKLDVRNGHIYIGDDDFANPGSWGATLNIDDNVHSRVLIEERATGVQTSLWAHTGGNAKVGTISNHNFGIITNGSEKLQVMTNGNVGIGTGNPSERLEVNGTIRSKKVKVQATGWPDYVFESDYKLTPLSQLEAFVKTNKHLPDVPSAKEVEAHGQDLGDIQATLLKKVEELTLYLIEENKAKTVLEKENAKLKQVLAEVLTRLEKLENNK